MRVLATILALLISVAGFVYSYEVAYKKIIVVMNSSTERSQTVSQQSR